MKIKIINPKSISIFSYYIRISNAFGVISEGFSKNNKYYFDSYDNTLYKLEIFNRCISPYYKKIYFINTNDLVIYFYKNNVFSFYLIDKHYKMPIKEGIINLWMKKKR